MNAMKWMGAVAAAATMLVSPALAQEDLPSGVEVIEKAIEATGGKDAYLAVKSRKASMTVSIPAFGMNMTVAMTQKAPNKLLIENDVPGMMSGRTGTDGTNFWSTDTMNGPRILEGEEQKQLLQQADMYADINYKDNYTDIECVGTADFGGEKCYKVTMTSNASGQEETRYYSIESGLMLASETVTVSMMGEMPTKTRLSDYRDVEGLKVPFKTSLEQGPQTLEITIESLEFNVDLDDSVFEMPDDVKDIAGDG